MADEFVNTCQSGNYLESTELVDRTTPSLKRFLLWYFSRMDLAYDQGENYESK